MQRFLILVVFCFSFSYAGLINAIAIIVNDEPITLYDIDKQMVQNNFTKQEAVDTLIDQMLYDQEIKQNGISVDIFDIDDYISKLANQNNLSILDFKALVSQQQDYEQFKDNIKKQLLHQKLVQKIAAGKLKIATDEDLKIYYDNNIEQFKQAKEFSVMAYVSKDKESLESIKLNPLMANSNVVVQNISLKQEELNPQVKYILNSTKEKTFSVIFAQNRSYNMFFISDKKDVVTKSFDEVKEEIFSSIMKGREDSFLKNYFETLKITADIKVLR